MSQYENKPSPLVLYSGLAGLILFTIGILVYFFYVASITIYFLVTLPNHISFDKGAFYLLGAGVGLSALIFAGIYESCLGKVLSKKTSSRITKVALAGLLVMFSLPHVMHYLADRLLKKQGYLICDQTSHQWLHSKTIVYVKNSNICSLPDVE